jgi:hypothetical protein
MLAAFALEIGMTFELFYLGLGLGLIGVVVCVKYRLTGALFELSVLIGQRSLVQTVSGETDKAGVKSSKEGVQYILQGSVISLATIIICFVIPLFVHEDPLARLRKTWHIGTILLVIGLGQLYWGIRQRREWKTAQQSSVAGSERIAEPPIDDGAVHGNGAAGWIRVWMYLVTAGATLLVAGLLALAIGLNMIPVSMREPVGHLADQSWMKHSAAWSIGVGAVMVFLGVLSRIRSAK